MSRDVFTDIETGEGTVGDERTQEKQESSILYIRQGESNDGYAEVTVSPDRKKAVAHFYPPIPGGAFLTVPVFLGKLADAGIIHGIQQTAVEEAVFKANSTHEPVRDVVIALGTESTHRNTRAFHDAQGISRPQARN